MASTEPLVRFNSVQKTYDGHTLVVRDLNLDIQGGEFLSLLGPSGSGKTTRGHDWFQSTPAIAGEPLSLIHI